MTNDALTALLLGILEGLTEFLPVSSTGHLILASELIGFTGESSVTFKIAIQFGAILAVIAVYWRRFWGVGTGLLRLEERPIAFARNILLGLRCGARAYMQVIGGYQVLDNISNTQQLKTLNLFKLMAHGLQQPIITQQMHA